MTDEKDGNRMYEGEPQVDQMVFRWQGNRARQGAGIAPVATSRSWEAAEELAAELAPLLRVDGQAPRPSLVRGYTARGEVVLIQRWPVKDAVGRPSTACHLLLGDESSLRVDRCVLLNGWGWSDRSTAEEAKGLLPRISVAEALDPYASANWEPLLKRLRDKDLARPLRIAAAQWLRTPRQRLSLLCSGLPRWPDENVAPVVLMGLYLIFGDWLRQPWTFATYDTTDRHPLRVTFVPDWQLDSEQSGPLVRLDPSRSRRDDRAQHIAHQLVLRLARRDTFGRNGDPLLAELPDAAGWSEQERLDELERRITESRRGEPPVEYAEPYEYAEHRAHPPARQPVVTAPQAPSAPRASEEEQRWAHRLRPALSRLNARTPPEEASSLRSDAARYPDAVLIDQLGPLRTHGAALDLLLGILAERGERRTMGGEDAAALCHTVLDLHLCHPEPGRPAEWAAWLFSWAVAPFARSSAHEPKIAELIELTARHPTSQQWRFLELVLLETPPRQLPDLEPKLWQTALGALSVDRREPTPPPSPEPPPSPAPEPVRPPAPAADPGLPADDAQPAQRRTSWDTVSRTYFPGGHRAGEGPDDSRTVYVLWAAFAVVVFVVLYLMVRYL